MERDTAEQLMKIYSDIGEKIDLANVLICDISDEEERKKLLTPYGKIVGDIWYFLQSPIVKQFPDLDPDLGTEWHEELQKKGSSKKSVKNAITAC